MSEPFIGEVRIFGFDFPPRRWARCDGSLMAIQQNSALFSLLGTTYGGNGQTTFGLPDLRGRAPVHPGNSALGNTVQGEASGSENVTLLNAEMPAHSHATRATTDAATATTPGGNLLGAKPRGGADVFAAPGNFATLLDGAVGNSGGNLPHSNLQPSLAVNFCIALSGIFPSRN